MQKARKTALCDRWVRYFPQASVERSVHVFNEVWDAYSEAHRDYHDVSHVEWLLAALDEHFPQAPLEAELALWLHDVIYIPGDPDSELLSGQFAELKLTYLKCEPEVFSKVRTAIEQTKNHQPDNVTSMIVCDLDLLGLALPRDEYVANTARIQREFSAYKRQWRAGRLHFIESLLARPNIFMLKNIQDWYEAAARHNLELDRELLTAQ